MSARLIVGTLVTAVAAVGLTAVAVTAFSSGPKPAPSSKPGPGPAPGTSTKLGGFEFTEWNVTEGGDKATALATVVVLHDLSSGPDDVRLLLQGLDVPARIIVPLGAVGAGQSRSYVDPQNPDPTALQKAAIDLQAFLFAVVQARPTVGRLIVVGLGTSGMLAVSLGMYASSVVSLAVAMGGAYDQGLVPIPQTGTTQIVMLAQETSPTLQQTDEAFKVAATRGFTVELVTGDFDLPVTAATAKMFLWPRLYNGLGKP